jgi:acyl-coenzyme A thioesterase PaaI-like protein
MTALAPGRWDDQALGALRVEAHCNHAGPSGLLYAIAVQAAGGRLLLEGRATVILPA